MTYLFLVLAVVGVVLVQSGALMQIAAHDITLAAPYLVAQGLPLYSDTFINHPPLLPLVMTVSYHINPDPLTNLRVLNVLMVLGTGALAWWAARRMGGWGALACGFYWLWATTYNDLYLYLDALVGTLSVALLLVGTFPRTWRTLLLMGVLAGLAIIIKQNALAVGLAPFVWLFFWRESWRAWARQSAWVLLGALAVVLAQVALLAAVGVLNEARFALFNPGNATWLSSLSGLLNGNAWRELATTGALLPAAFALWWVRGRDGVGGLAWWLLLAAFVLNVPVLGYYHAMAILPIVAVWVGVVAREAWRALPSPALVGGAGVGYLALCAVVAGAPLLGFVLGERDTIGWDELTPVSAWLRENTPANARVLVLPAYDTNANLYAQAERLPPYYMKTWWHHAAYEPNAERLQARVLANPPDVIVWFSDHYKSVAGYFPRFDALLAQYTPAETWQLPHQGAVVALVRR